MFHIFESLPSTNDYCLEYSALHPGERLVCIANHQTQGRGRHGKKWHSEDSSNLYLSYLRPMALHPAHVAPLSLLVGLVIAQLFESIGVKNIELKWPNDILIAGAKIAGILIEGSVIGIGINLTRPHVDIDQAVTGLKEEGVTLDKMTLAHDLIERLESAITLLETSGFQPFMADWARFDCLAGHEVAWHNGRLSGVSSVIGINEHGQLMLTTAPYLLTSGSVTKIPPCAS